IVTPPVYVPGPSWIVSPSCAAASAAWNVGRHFGPLPTQSGFPPGAEAADAAPTRDATATATNTRAFIALSSLEAGASAAHTVAGPVVVDLAVVERDREADGEEAAALQQHAGAAHEHVLEDVGTVERELRGGSPVGAERLAVPDSSALRIGTLRARRMGRVAADLDVVQLQRCAVGQTGALDRGRPSMGRDRH